MALVTVSVAGVRANRGSLVRDLGQMSGRNPAMQRDPSFVIALRENLAVGRDVGEQSTVVHTGLDVHVNKTSAQR